MKKRLASLLLAAFMAVSLCACASGDKSGYPNEDGIAEGKLGDTMHNAFFDYTVNSAYLCSQYEDYIPTEGKELLVADVTVKNTFSQSITMYDTDFQVQWGDDSKDAFDAPVTYYLDAGQTLGEDVFPTEYDLAVNESRKGLLVFEVPAGKKDFSISYQELFDDDSTGNLFFVYFTAEKEE